MSESEKPEKNDGVTVVSGGIPADGASTLPAKEGGKMSRMKASVKKLYHAVAPYVGDLAESGRVAAAGFALKQHAEGVVTHVDSAVKFGDAYAKLSEQYGPEIAEQMLRASPKTFALRYRAGTRLLHMEEQRQQNIESVALRAEQKLPEKVSEEPIKPDWMARFIESVKDVSDETMQSLWSSILAGEVGQPGRTSFRTMEVLKNLSQKDAELFNRLASRCLFGGSAFKGVVYYPVKNDMKTSEFILPYSGKINLQECGLIHHEPDLSVRFSNMDSVRVKCGGFLFEIAQKDNVHSDVSIPIIQLTRPGREIAQFIPVRTMPFPDTGYIRKLTRCLEHYFASFRVIAKMPAPAMAGVPPISISHIDTPSGDEGIIWSNMTEDEMNKVLLDCPRQAVVK